LDLHGFERQPEYVPGQLYDVILGTSNCHTIRHFDDQNQKEWERSDETLSQQLREVGLSVFLPGYEPIRLRQWRKENGPYLMGIDLPICGPDNNRDFESFMAFEESLTQEDKQRRDAKSPPSTPDDYNGGYLIRSHFGEGVAAAIQIELSPELREPRSRGDTEGAKKRERFIATVSSVICSLQ